MTGGEAGMTEGGPGMTWSTEMTWGGAGMTEKCRDSGESGDGGAYRSGAGGMQFFPWERQSPHWHPSGSGKRQPFQPAAEICPATYSIRHPCIRRCYVSPPPSRPPPGVIPAQAGILTRISLYKGRTVTNNYAAIPSRHTSYGKGDELCVLKSLVWIRAI